jgi:thermitase
MKSLFILLGGLLTAGAYALPADSFVSNEVLVKFKPNSAYAKAVAINLANGQIKQELSHIGWTVVRFGSGTVADAVHHFKGFSEVQYAEPNYIRRKFHTPNDPRFSGEQLGMKKTKVELAWDLTKGSSGVIIAVLDTGVQLNHPDLQSKLVPGFDYSDNDADPSDGDGHGTHCAGNVGASTNNAVGPAGAGYNCRIMPLKIFPNATISVIANATKHAADNGAKVLSMSFGGYGFSQAEQDSMNYTWNKGCLNVAAAGNDGTTQMSYPASLDNVLSVAATNDLDQPQGWSNYGTHIDVAAAGLDVMSTYLGSTYARVTGTSMSCPIVAGIAGLVYSRGGGSVTPTQVRDAIQDTTDFVGANWIANGRVNAFAAVQQVAPPVIVDMNATSVSIHTGSSSSGSVANTWTSDNLYYRVNSAASGGIGQVAAANVNIQLSATPGTLNGLKLSIEANGASGGTMFVYLKNRFTGAFDVYRSFAVSTGDKLFAMDIAPVGTYVSASSVVNAIVRVTRSPRLSPNVPFGLNIDRVKLTGTYLQ